MTTGTETYAQARAHFLAEAKTQGYELVAFALPEVYGPDTEILTCDLAIRKTGKAKSAIVTTSAVHGVEGAAGSLLQQEWLKWPPAANVDIIHIHALNPYGYAWDRRADHHNIDVNRNFVADWATADENPRYKDYADIIVPRGDGAIARLRQELQMIWLQLSPGAAVMKDIITKGQYGTSEGMYYGGQQPSWSRTVWERIISEYLSGYEHVVHLDVHTGLGMSGDLQIIAASGNDRGAALARYVWGAQAAFIDDGGRNTSVSSPTTGAIENSWDLVRGAKPAEAVSFTLEFGTWSPLKVFRALQAEHSAFARGKMTDADGVAARARMRWAFAPDDAVWRAQVLKNGNRAYAGIVSALDQALFTS